MTNVAFGTLQRHEDKVRAAHRLPTGTMGAVGKEYAPFSSISLTDLLASALAKPVSLYTVNESPVIATPWADAAQHSTQSSAAHSAAPGIVLRICDAPLV